MSGTGTTQPSDDSIHMATNSELTDKQQPMICLFHSEISSREGDLGVLECLLTGTCNPRPATITMIVRMVGVVIHEHS